MVWGKWRDTIHYIFNNPIFLIIKINNFKGAEVFSFLLSVKVDLARITYRKNNIMGGLLNYENHLNLSHQVFTSK